MECSHATWYIMSGFSSHWPSCAHGTQDSCWSVQLKVHTPHESGHREVIESGFFAHSPSRALVRVGRWLWLTGKPLRRRRWGRVARMACGKGGAPVAAVGAHVVAYARRSICEVEEEDGESGRAGHHFRRRRSALAASCVFGASQGTNSSGRMGEVT